MDIVEKLYFYGSGEPFQGPHMIEAAHEIERLRARVAAAHSIISDLVGVFDEWPEHEVRKAREGYGYEPMPNRLRAWLADGDEGANK